MALPLLPESLRNLLSDFERLPGVGAKSAQRMVFALLRRQPAELEKFAQDLLALRATKTCRICGMLAETDECTICRDPHRLTSFLCIVETPLDVIALERTGEYRGRYHVLGGVLSPLEHIGPEQLAIASLLRRVLGEATPRSPKGEVGPASAHESDGPVQEIILALNPSTEGETTALYIQDLLKEFPGTITRLARGLPTGATLEFADDLTLARAIAERREITPARVSR
ncbi:MAG: recombination protein RecR [Parcubacteria group bacterium Gr01-1014_106]|nr:MAG: recombination protein RecR [Parcubacteria group bacterium Gr01-1014_106]